MPYKDKKSTELKTL